MKFSDITNLLKENNLLLYSTDKDFTIKNLSYNSKEIKDKTLFICKGFNFKKEYLDEAIEKGATSYIAGETYNVDIPCIIVTDIRKAMAVIASAFYKDNLIKVGVTGTKGKTTTVNFIKNILNHKQGYKIGYISTIDYYTGKSSGASHNTTPESLDLHKYLHEMTEKDLKYVAMEVSSQATYLDRVYQMNFDYGCFLNIGTDHISPHEHHSFEEYFEAKLQFLRQSKTCIVFNETKNYKEIIEELTKLKKKVITYGYKNADYIISNVKKEDDGTSFDLTYKDKTKTYKITMPGAFNVLNATCAIIVTSLMGASYKDILEGLYETKVLGRMNIFNTSKCPVIVDYAHNKLSLEALIKSIKEDYKNKNIKLVFGCPGNKGINRREEMGTLAGEYASYTYLTNEDSETEDPYEICKIIATYIEKYNKPYEIITDREEAIKKALTDATENDIIAIVGKGDETYQLIGGEYVPYKSDIKVVEEFIQNELEKIK